MKTPRLIVITGFDGSGKTTIAKLLVKSLKSKGYRTKYVWIKSLHTLAYLISLILKCRNIYGQVKNPDNMMPRFELSNHVSLNRVWPLIEFISIMPWVILKIHLAILFGYTIVADRYLIDTVISVSTRIHDVHFVNTFLARLLLRMIPKEAAVIYLDVDLHTVLKRRPDIEYTADEIQGQIVLYRLLAEKIGAYLIDTTMLSIEDVETKVVDYISARAGERN